MTYRAFPIARPKRTTARAPRVRPRLVLTLIAAVVVAGGLVRLATDQTAAQVATPDLIDGSGRAASTDRALAVRLHTE